MQVGLVGFGRLGKLLCSHLSQDSDLLIYDILEQDDGIRKHGGTPASLEQVAKCQIILLIVPISAMQEALKSIAPLLKKDALVVDVCSVKKYPTEWMEEILPSSVSILGTHPMFGPDSAKDSVFGKKIVLCPVRIEDKLLSNIATFLRGHGMKVIESSPEEHDRQIAHSLVLTHFVGRSLLDFKAAPLDIDTLGYRRLMKILGVVENDTWQLFQDMNNYNPYAEEVRKGFISSMENVQNRIKS
jgi:prephenate dehydrogenase